jgi:hypothetical protein
MLIVPHRWRRPPPGAVGIDWSHPLASGFENPQAFFYAFQGDYTSLTGVNDCAPTNSPTFVGVPDGQVLRLVSASQQIVTAVSPSVTYFNPQGTFYWQMSPTSTYNDGTQRAIFGAGNVTPMFSGQSFTDNNLYIGWGDASDTRVIIANSASYWLPGRFDSWALTWVDAGLSILYVNGVEVGRNSGGTDTFDASAAPLRIGSLGESFGIAFDGYFSYAAFTGRAHSAAEVREFHQNPWQIFKPRQRRTFFSTGPSLVIYRPGSDIASGGWTNNDGAASPLFSRVDEVVEDDADYIQSAVNPSADIAEIQFQNVQPPSLNTNHTISYKIKGDASTPLVVDLIAGNGSTIVKTWTHNPAPSTYTRYDRTLTTGEADAWAAAGYPGSRLRLTAN